MQWPWVGLVSTFGSWQAVGAFCLIVIIGACILDELFEAPARRSGKR